jgi:hypothetical protein
MLKEGMRRVKRERDDLEENEFYFWFFFFAQSFFTFTIVRLKKKIKKAFEFLFAFCFFPTPSPPCRAPVSLTHRDEGWSPVLLLSCESTEAKTEQQRQLYRTQKKKGSR